MDAVRLAASFCLGIAVFSQAGTPAVAQMTAPESDLAAPQIPAWQPVMAILPPKRPAPMAPDSAGPLVLQPTQAVAAAPPAGFQPLSQPISFTPAFQPIPRPAAASPRQDGAEPPPVPARSVAPPPPAPSPRPLATAAATRSEPVAQTRSVGQPPVPTPSQKPVVTAATPQNEPVPQASAPLSDQAIIELANAYFSRLRTLVADFTQIGGDGRRLTGQLYLQRPGKVRFEYEEPSSLEVIADGSSVAVRDRKLATQDLYAISQTPLKFLLRDRVDIGKDLRVTDISQDLQGVRITLEDRSTLGGTSKITLFFDQQVQTLSRWRIVDPQGFQTTVILSNVETARRVDQSLFVINYERMLRDNPNR